MSRPSDDPLGAKPVLPAPGAGALRRGQSLFKQLLDLKTQDAKGNKGNKGATGAASLGSHSRDVEREERQRPQLTAPKPSHRPYSKALAAVASLVATKEPPLFGVATKEPPLFGVATKEPPLFGAATHKPPSLGDDDSGVGDGINERLRAEASALSQGWREHEDDSEETSPNLQAGDDESPAVVVAGRDEDHDDDHDEDLLARPPPGMASVRGSVPKPAAGDASRAELTGATQSMFIEQPDGSQVMDFTIEHDTLDAVQCRLVNQAGTISAVLFADDVNTRRLLDAEAGALRVRLEEKGLRVASVKVEMMPDLVPKIPL